MPPVPPVPDTADVARATDLLLDQCFGEFPLVGRAGRANLLAAMLTQPARELFEGQAPIFLIDAPAPGTGKTLLVQTVGTIVSGQIPPATSETRDREERRKWITATLREGPPVVLIDNVLGCVDWGELAALSTSPWWQSRILGRTETVRVPNRAIWFVTATTSRRAPRSRGGRSTSGWTPEPTDRLSGEDSSMRSSAGRRAIAANSCGRCSCSFETGSPGVGPRSAVSHSPPSSHGPKWWAGSWTPRACPAWRPQPI